MPRSTYRINDALSYSYEPLHAARDMIRLTELLPDKSHRDLRCRLFQTRLTSRPYEALSYTWGSEKKPCFLYVDQYCIQITKNLSSALRHLRYPDRSRFLWVDAVSINQESKTERNHQVRIMSSIYHQARDVIVWLGAPKIQDGNKLRSEKILNVVNVRCQPFHDGLTDGTFWQELLHSPWFQRAWVIQELVHASHITVRFGNKELKWSDLVNVAAFTHRVDNPDDNPLKSNLKCMSATRTILLMCEWRNILKESRGIGSPLRIENVVHNIRASECSLGADKIYSMLSIVPRDDGRLLFDPDYRLCLDDVEFQLAKASLVNYESLNVLRYVDHGRSTIILPSWVPHFDPEQIELLPVSNRQPYFNWDDVHIRHCEMPSPCDGTLRKMRLLCLQGFTVLDIGCVGSIIYGSCNPNSSTRDVSSIISSRESRVQDGSAGSSLSLEDELAIDKQDQRTFSQFVQNQYVRQGSHSNTRWRKLPTLGIGRHRYQRPVSSVPMIEPVYRAVVRFPALAEIALKGRVSTTWPTKAKASPLDIARGRKLALTEGGIHVLVPLMAIAATKSLCLQGSVCFSS
ncbi:MAG: hypothetical protein MMC33_001007 [Icmadophila ericetorum]|nr:hypothetical protein [Icmadophila ericetorum]